MNFYCIYFLFRDYGEENGGDLSNIGNLSIFYLSMLFLSESISITRNTQQRGHRNHFPLTTKTAADDFENKQ